MSPCLQWQACRGRAPGCGGAAVNTIQTGPPPEPGPETGHDLGENTLRTKVSSDHLSGCLCQYSHRNTTRSCNHGGYVEKGPLQTHSGTTCFVSWLALPRPGYFWDQASYRWSCLPSLSWICNYHHRGRVRIRFGPSPCRTRGRTIERYQILMHAVTVAWYSFRGAHPHGRVAHIRGHRITVHARACLACAETPATDLVRKPTVADLSVLEEADRQRVVMELDRLVSGRSQPRNCEIVEIFYFFLYRRRQQAQSSPRGEQPRALPTGQDRSSFAQWCRCRSDHRIGRWPQRLVMAGPELVCCMPDDAPVCQNFLARSNWSRRSSAGCTGTRQRCRVIAPRCLVPGIPRQRTNRVCISNMKLPMCTGGIDRFWLTASTLFVAVNGKLNDWTSFCDHRLGMLLAVVLVLFARRCNATFWAGRQLQRLKAMFVVATCLACLCARVVPSSWTTVYTVHRQVAAYLGTGCLRQRCVSSTLLPAREILDPAISPQRLLRTIMVKLPCCYTSSEPSLWLRPLWLGAHMSRQRQRRPTGRTCNLCDCLCAPSHF